MKKILLMATGLLIFTACKKEQGDNITVTTTEEITKVDTVGNKEQTTTVITKTVETDTGEVSISTGGLKEEPLDDNQQL